MAKKQTRRSISVSRVTYERLKAFCETNHISMSQFVETRVGDFLDDGSGPPPRATPRPTLPSRTEPVRSALLGARPIPMTCAAVRHAVDPPLPVIKPRHEAAPEPAPKTADQIFTF